MSLPITFYAVAVMAIFFTGLSKSGFGGGLGMMSVPFMSMFVAPQFAAVVMMPILLAMDIIIVWTYRKSWDRKVVLVMLPGALFGLAVGAASFQWMDPDLVRIAIGILALLLVGMYLIGRSLPEVTSQPHAATVFALGSLSGFSSFIAHAGGPPVKGFLLRQNFEKSVFVGTNTVFFFTLNFLKTISYSAMGQFTHESLLTSLVLSPVLVLGVVAGTSLHKHVDQRKFVTVIYGLLFLAGTKLLWDGLMV